MIAVIQRVSSASVTIDGDVTGQIDSGLMILLGIETADDATDIEWLTRKVINLRVFDDSEGVMNESLLDIDGNVLLISQFTLQASTKKGNRPSYLKAARPEVAIPLYKDFIESLENQLKKKIETGEFGADMKVTLTNDGPVTILIDSRNRV